MEIPRKYQRSWPSAFFGIALTLACLWGLFAGAQQAKPAASGADSRAGRGKYIVEDVAMCGTCHSPRTESGDLDRTHWLDGASLWLLPAHPTSDWPLKAPRLAGSPAASDDELIRLLTTGIWKDGSHLRAPMPQFRMSREDAEAVVAYLRSLTPSPQE
jgi:mono/diheme cytochrome c family protein